MSRRGKKLIRVVQTEPLQLLPDAQAGPVEGRRRQLQAVQRQAGAGNPLAVLSLMAAGRPKGRQHR
jgi:hypothetical protein